MLLLHGKCFRTFNDDRSIFVITLLVFGIGLGLSAGVSPGPLLTLVVSEVMQYDVKAGIRVAIAPVLSDFPILMISFFLWNHFSNVDRMLGIVSLVGGLVIFFMGIDHFRSKPIDVRVEGVLRKSIRKGIWVNILNPHPYLFWFGVGAPTMTKAANQGFLHPLAFIVPFYVFLVGSKILLAVLVGNTKAFFVGNLYRNLVRTLGVVLLLFASMLFVEGLQFLGLRFV